MESIEKRIQEASNEDLEILESRLNILALIGRENVEKCAELVSKELNRREAEGIESIVDRDDVYAIASSELWEYDDDDEENNNNS